MKDNEKLDKREVHLKDRQGRGWKYSRLEIPAKKCYSLKCVRKGQFELSLVSQGLCRREVLCGPCLGNRLQHYGMNEIIIVSEN
jgi:hypothetical protein